MKRKWKIVLFLLVLVLAAGGYYASTIYAKRGIVTVQTGRVSRQDLTSLVTASGEIKPRNYINIGANAQGYLVSIVVKEGQHVRKGQLLAEIDSVQQQADVTAQKAAISSAEADAASAEVAVKVAGENLATLQAGIDRAKADLVRTKADYDRAAQMLKEQLIARQQYDQTRAANEVQIAAVREAETRLIQARSQREQTAAQLTASQRRIAQVKATLARASEELRRHSVFAPLDGMVTNLPVRVGETVVPGIQNSAASTIMTIADMSLITAEVKVDETDIVNVKLQQTADVTIDAIPGKTFKGKVIEIGNTAILRSTGVAASQSNISSQEAKDFKVVIALEDPPDEIRPGLSATAKVTTATRPKVLTIPLQALTVRQKGDLEPKKEGKQEKQDTAVRPDPVAEKARREELQGVFVVAGDKVEFRKVETGITGSTDIEVVSGLNDGDQIVTGSYQIIRTVRNQAQIKVDNKTPEKKG